MGVGVGVAPGATTTVWSALALSPMSSVTVRRTVKLPAALGTMVAVLALAALLNPVTMPVECFRYFLLGTGWVNVSLLFVSIGTTAIALISGVLVFQRVEKTFVDVV